MSGCRKKAEEPHYETKGALKSKKFIAYLVADIGWKIILGLMLYWQKEGLEAYTIMMAVVVVAGFVQVGFILGQASLDRYVRVAEIASKAVKSEKDKSV